MYEITLEDGTVLKNLDLNGNNYISDTVIKDDVFKNNLKNVSISEGKKVTPHSDMKLIQNKVVEGKSWFILTEKTKEEREKENFNQLLADLTELVLVGGGI